MPELNLRIFSRNYRLAVTPGEEPVLTQCAQRVDQHMEAIRNGGRVVALDQIAVLAALEIAYDDNKTQTELEARIADLEVKAAEAEEAARNQPEPELPLEPAEEPEPQKPEPVEAAPQPVVQPSDEARWEKEIDALCRMCEEAIYSSPGRPAGFF